MKNIKSTLFLICSLFVFTLFGQSIPSIIPKPKSIKMAGGQVTVRDIQTIVIPKKNIEIKNLALQYASALGLDKYQITEQQKPEFAKNKSLVFQLVNQENQNDYYSFTVTKNGILVAANGPKGVFYALQTLIQLLESSNQTEKTLPFISIEDEPVFGYRGMHLDVARHFFPVAAVKRYLDLLARYKMNYFHWHLTDDQGWRIEIKKFPKLTEVGAYRKGTALGHAHDAKDQKDQEDYGSYYTQEEIKEIIQYAKERHIEIIPEIEMPGHSSAALAAYPEFGCTGGPYHVASHWGVFKDVFCTKDTALWFVKEVLGEVCDLFPGKYFHVGGDEVPKDRWKACSNCQSIRKRQGLKSEDELQSYFIEQVGIYLFNRGKKLIGWDEIMEGGLAPNATVMSWRGTKGGIEAAKLKHEVIMCPGSHCYFDHYQSESSKEPLAIGGYTSLEKVYGFKPIPEELKSDERRFVLGAQGNLWTEYIPGEEHLQYMAFPRAIALAEILWSESNALDYKNFVERLAQHSNWFKKNKFGFCNAYLDLAYQTSTASDGVKFTFVKPPVDGRILLESEKPDEGIVQEYPVSDSFLLEKDLEFGAWYQLPDKTLGRALRLHFQKHLAAGKSIQLKYNPSAKYPGSGAQCLVNGFSAPSHKFGGSEWMGFEADDLEADIDLGTEKDIQNISIQFYQANDSWIYAPEEILVYSSQDGKQYDQIQKVQVPLSPKKIILQEIALKQKTKSRYLRIVAKNAGRIAEGLPGAGHKAWLFVGEIRVE
ncbi:MAG: family 20 glycosylhydrolase [Saprospiraceae bacterium]|nr:family 20 glycosylhydrolase [Saprospiraceae bacterium]